MAVARLARRAAATRTETAHEASLVSSESARLVRMIGTRAASGIPGFDDLIEDARCRAPLPREVEIDDVGSLCAFLVSGAAQAITGDVHYVDGGYHILA